MSLRRDFLKAASLPRLGASPPATTASQTEANAETDAHTVVRQNSIRV